MKRRRAVTASLSVVAVLLLAQVVMGLALVRPDMGDRARAWIADMSDAEKAALAATISEYPVDYRLAYLRSISPAERAVLYRAHIVAFMSDNTNVTTEQRAYLTRVAEYLEGLTVAPAPGQVPEWIETGRRLFDKATSKSLFRDLGPDDAMSGNREPGLNYIFGVVARHTIVLAEMEDCDCSTEDTYCLINCIEGGYGEPCEPVPEDCGTFLWFDCDGTCQPWISN